MTSGFGVERLEQCMAAGMEAVWNGRSEWEREKVAREVEKSVEEVAREASGEEEEETGRLMRGEEGSGSFE